MIKKLNVVINEKLEEINSFGIDELEEDGLFSGKLGLLYFYLSIYRHDKKVEYKDKIEHIIAIIFNNIELETSSLLLSSSLGDGLSGLGYIINELKKDGFVDTDFDDQLSAINEMACNSCLALIEEENFDYIAGSIGVLHYLTLVKAEDFVSKIVDNLYDYYITNENKFYNNTDYLEGIHIGYAHGLCAIVKVLNGVKNNTKSDIIIESILNDFLHSCINTDSIINDSKYFLPRSIHKNEQGDLKENWRPVLAWSNSDLNFSTLIHSIDAKYVKSIHFDYANRIIEESAKRRVYNQTRIDDYRFSFGASGTAQLYCRLEHLTGSQTAKEMHAFWIKQTLELLSEKNCTIQSHKLDLLNNLPGTLLALIQFRDSSFSDWDKLFLL